MTTTPLWDKLASNASRIEALFDDYLNREERDHPEFKFLGWQDSFWSNDHIRKCHLKTIDRRADKKLWLMHINIFPRSNIHLPILGFDLVAGPGKVTGAFFDYSTPYRHPYMDYLEMYTRDLEWNKPRELPDWARKIFSSNMIAAGNIREGEELDRLLEVTYDLISIYLDQMTQNAFPSQTDMTEYHNLYCSEQKKNPHLHRSILALDISEEYKDRYVNEILFEEI